MLLIEQIKFTTFRIVKQVDYYLIKKEKSFEDH
jgi:hypothetical protein